MNSEIKKEISRLEKENQELKQRIGTLEHDLIHDELTGLKTRKFIADTSKMYLKSIFNTRNTKRKLDSLIPEKHIGFLFCDIDFFKKVNDSLGHSAGDEVLVSVSAEIEKNVRDKDIVARFGGEEILVTLLDVSEENAKNIAEKLRESVSKISFAKFPNLQVTISVGVSSTERSYLTKEGNPDVNIDSIFDEYIERADSAVYMAKNTGRNRVVVWSPDLEEIHHSKSIRTRILQVFKDRRI
jgi:diguanylate cyclase (GGDEF)-like protein